MSVENNKSKAEYLDNAKTLYNHLSQAQEPAGRQHIRMLFAMLGCLRLAGSTISYLNLSPAGLRNLFRSNFKEAAIISLEILRQCDIGSIVDLYIEGEITDEIAVLDEALIFSCESYATIGTSEAEITEFYWLDYVAKQNS